MSRITAPAAKIARTITSTTTAPAIRTSALFDSSFHHGSSLTPQYAELLSARSNEHGDSSRGLTTTHRPTPQPSLANRSRPLMQSFASVATSSPAMTESHLDASVIPNMNMQSSFDAQLPRMPLLPDNYHTAHEPFTSSHTIKAFSTEILAADPAKVAPGGALSAVRSFGLDGIDVKFVHGEDGFGWGKSSNGAQDGSIASSSGGMLRDIWRGMVEDVLGGAGSAKKAA